MINWKKIHYFTYTFCRYFLATMIISYAFAKIFETQFISQPSVYDKPIGNLSGFELTWFYYGYSYWYGLIIASTQIISSLLLFFRQTTRIGIIIFLTFMINILLMDFAYDIDGAKGMAVVLTIMALFVFFSDYNELIKYFIKTPPLFEKERTIKINKISKLKFIYIPLVFIGLFVLITTLKDKFLSQNQFFGAWENVENNERIYFESANTFQKVNNSTFKPINSGTYTFEKDSIYLKGTQEENQTPEIILKGKFNINNNELKIETTKGVKFYKRIR
ncbi:hypothetical protein F0358_10040 [Empedobacter brevis]|uniref:hypothetical protein n=1 Tax=Empedobacter brevis TaxID=247 RepID=UPI00123E2CFF|nr:hypothetical protein [Empedobacter brevis]QES93026.1 hypothetical protein F0358_10040 [Empedobacter brevis]